LASLGVKDFEFGAYPEAVGARGEELLSPEALDRDLAPEVGRYVYVDVPEGVHLRPCTF
jgi:hypothetical protein